LFDHHDDSVAQAYLNQKRLDTEAKHLHHNATNFAKQTHQWLQLVQNFSSSLKEIGDVENWAKSIESDMQTVSSSLEYAYKGIDNFVMWKLLSNLSPIAI
jgi:biogenesis of lysosome-related organelles complex 1 subunit 1